MKTNKKPISTFKSAPAARRVAGGSGAVADTITAEQQLRRCVLTNLLWEDQHYESGVDVAKTIADLVPKVDPTIVSELAIEARTKQKLRHAPLFLVREMARHVTHRPLVADTLAQVIQRADELGEFLALYWKDGRQPLANSVKKGLARAFPRFDAYQLAKYSRDQTVTLKDALFLSHAKPQNAAQAALWKQLIDDTLPVPDTWEVELSKSKDKTASWTRLIQENRLGALAYIRNLRNMKEAKVDINLIRAGLGNIKAERVLPFRFIAAAKEAKEFEAELETLMFRCLAQFPKLPGKTVFIVDVSGSMGSGISGKSDMSRLDAAAALTALIREVAENAIIYCTAGNDATRVHQTQIVPARRGFALIEEIKKQAHQLGGGGIFVVQACKHVAAIEKTADRLLVLSDSQDCDYERNPNSAQTFGKFNYLFDVAAHTKGVAYKAFTHIDGWSENVIDFIYHAESPALN